MNRNPMVSSILSLYGITVSELALISDIPAQHLSGYENGLPIPQEDSRLLALFSDKPLVFHQALQEHADRLPALRVLEIKQAVMSRLDAYGVGYCCE